MLKVIIPGKDERYLAEAVSSFRAARLPVALTGAGISVESGIPDFRSPGGLWTRFSPDEYATLNVFLSNPEKAWQLYRALGKILEGKKPNTGHAVLAELEKRQQLYGIVTQNVDRLHQQAGSSGVLEVHGDHHHLECLRCGELEEVVPEHYSSTEIPACRECGMLLKPNVVLFGESVRRLNEIHALLAHCDLLLVIGTSAQVYPAAGLPMIVKQNNGLVYEFNVEETELSRVRPHAFLQSDFLFKGHASRNLQLFGENVLGEKGFFDTLPL